jgi:hypothetical protein
VVEREAYGRRGQLVLMSYSTVDEYIISQRKEGTRCIGMAYAPCTHDSPDTVTSWRDELVVFVAIMS